MRRRLFILAAAALFVWTALVQTTQRGPPSRAGPAAAPVTTAAVPSPASPTPTALRAAPQAVKPPAAANDAADPAAAAPTGVNDPRLSALVRRWCAAYERWGAHPTAPAAATLRALSTPRLYRSLETRRPTPAPTGAPAPAVAHLQLFAAPRGDSAIVDLRGDHADVVVELLVVATPAGPRVSALYL